MKAVVAAFNQEKALVGAFSVIVQLHRLIVYIALPRTPDSSASASAGRVAHPEPRAEQGRAQMAGKLRSHRLDTGWYLVSTERRFYSRVIFLNVLQW